MSTPNTVIDATYLTDANFMATHPEYCVSLTIKPSPRKTVSFSAKPDDEGRYTSCELAPLVMKKKKKEEYELGAPSTTITEKRQYKMWDTGMPVPSSSSSPPPSKTTKTVVVNNDIIDHHQKGVPLPTFRRMVEYVDRAMSNNDNNNAPRKPLVLDVHNNGPLSSKQGGEPDNYFLAYYPNNKAVALRLLQALYLTQGEEHSDLVQALCSPDLLEREMPSKKSRALVARYSGVKFDAKNNSRNDVGEWEYTYDIDDLVECFGQYIYVQQCHVNMDAMYGY